MKKTQLFKSVEVKGFSTKKLVDYLPFAALFVLPLLFYPGVNTSSWRSSSDVHAFFEFASSLLAITAGTMVLLHFFTTGRWFFLIISIGFVQIGAEEFVHAIFSFNRIWSEIPPTFKLAISTTWLTGHFILLASFFTALVFGEREIVSAKKGLNAVVCNIIGFICSASVALLIFNSPFLPHFVLIGSITKKLIELSLAFLYFAAFLFYSNIYLKQQSRSPLLWSIVACIIFRVFSHIFIFDAHAFYDAHWDAAHLMVFLSYFFPIFGVWGETIKLHKSAQMQVIRLAEEMAERKKAEETIKELNKSLEQRVKQRTAELEIANKELEAFSYSVSHDLKAPLRAMAGFANILSEDYAPKLDDNGRRLIGVINDNVKKMEQLIEDLLKLSHMARQALDVVDIDVTTLVQSVCHELKEELIRDRAIEMSVKPLPAARADLTLAKQIFTNLISNAMKFTAHKEKAVIEIGGYDKDGERVYYVKDNGAGFDMKYEDKLFGVFQRLHGQDEFSGTGIGLAIVSNAVRRHGGKVWAEGQVDKGATFYFTLPKGV
jgi:signal transduction histidine kinase